jgi:hypothetical protein
MGVGVMMMAIFSYDPAAIKMEKSAASQYPIS